ncbi:hypothetical protein WN944_007807 [Citrus x changshan-huyou]|uniref:Uncharacterized protein n=1 Tax=Citrus x changshan-huyou TaxID=2935761 RepID=A0AAP0MLS2_9ROSI
MNLSASQCKCSSSGSGCESGWTSYLDQSSLSRNRNQCYSLGDGHNEEEDDLSMVSDASSGPPHYCEHDEDCFDEKGSFCSPHLPSELAPAKSKNKKKIKQQQHNSYLDDTASSPKNISFSNNEASVEQVLGYSQGFSTTHLRVVSRRKVGMTNGDCNKFFLYSKVAQDRELGFGRHVKHI